MNFAIDFQQGASYKELNEAEKTLVKLYPVEAYAIKNNAKIAQEETIKQFGGNNVNDKSDAFRHATWSAMNERDCGKNLFTFEIITKKFGDAHETNTPPQFALEKQMDQFNNAVCREIGDVLFRILFTNYDIVSQVLTKIGDGSLRYLDPINYFDPDFSTTHGISSATTLVLIN